VQRHARTKPPAVRRTELLDAAERLFLADGVAATNVDAIVAAAGVAKGTFYLYFNAKEDLLPALRARYVEALAETVSAAVARRPHADWPGKLRAWVSAVVTYQVEHFALHELVFHDSGAHRGHAPLKEDTAETLAALLTDGARAGAWTVEDPRLLAVMLYAAVHAAVAPATHGRPNARRIAKALHAFFSRAVGLA